MQANITSAILTKWLLPLGILITLIGYFGPWVDHRVAGLVVMGLDLGEYVKFLLPVRGGQIPLWREGFYLPLLTASLVSSLFAFATTKTSIYQWIVRALLIIIAIVAALNMLPPAWAPWKLRLPEFRLQMIWLALCLAMMLVSPFLGLIPRIIRASVATILALIAIWFPVSAFLRVLPTISELYNNPVRPGWGMYIMILGLLLLIAGAWQTGRIQPSEESA